MTQPEQQSSYFEDQRKLISVILFVCRALAATVEVFLRRSNTFGDRYFGFQAAAGLGCILFYPVFWEGHDPRPLLRLLCAYIVMMVWVRMRTLARARIGGAQPHTLYSGTPRLMRITRRMKEETVKCIVEPVIVFVAGPLLAPMSEPLGAYLMLASLGLFVSANATAGFERRRLTDMNDAYIEQRNIVEGFRDLRGDRS